MTPHPVFWRRTLHILAGLVPLAYGVWRWQNPATVHSLLILTGLFYTIAVVLRRGRLVWGLAEYFQGAITLIFLDLALRHVQLGDLWAELREIDLPLMVWGWVVWAISIWFRGYRWYWLLAKEDGNTLRPWDAVFTTYVSFFGNYALPARAGEVLRILVLGQQTGISKTMAGASVAIEKVSDLIALIGMVIYLVGFTNLGGRTLRWIGLVGGGLTLALIFLLLVVIFLRKQLPLREEHLSIPGSQRFRIFLDRFVEGLRPAANPAHLVRYVLYSAIAWILTAYACYVFLQSQGVAGWLVENSRIGVISSVLLLVVLVNASTLIPAGPGSAGPYQALVVLSFTLLGTGAGVAGSEAYHVAAAFSIVFWIGTAVPSLLVGGALFFRSGLTFKLLRSAEREAADRMIHPDEENSAIGSGA